jgi:hypothetical protein
MEPGIIQLSCITTFLQKECTNTTQGSVKGRFGEICRFTAKIGYNLNITAYRFLYYHTATIVCNVFHPSQPRQSKGRLTSQTGCIIFRVQLRCRIHLYNSGPSMLPARSPESSASPSSPFINAHVSSNDHLRIPPHSVDALQWTTLIPDSIYPVPYDSDCWKRAHQIRKTCGCLKERFNSLEPELMGQVLLCFQQHRRQRFRDNWQLDHFEASQAVPR